MKKINLEKKPATDIQLIAKFRRGNKEAFNELVSRYETKAYNLCMRFLQCKEDAEEALQDVFLTLYKQAKNFEGKAAFSSWFYRVTVNAAFMRLRKRKQSRLVGMDEIGANIQNKHLKETAPEYMITGTPASNGELRTVIEAAINELEPEYRDTFILRDVDGLSNSEIAKQLKISIPAVKSRLHRGRIMLRKRLQTYYDDYTNHDQIIGVGPAMYEAEMAAA